MNDNPDIQESEESPFEWNKKEVTMFRSALTLTTLLLASTTAITACTQAPNPRNAEVDSAASLVAVEPVLPRVVVHKSSSCGCCTLWVNHLRESGFAVDVRDQDNLSPVKERVGVPVGKGSCHTAEVGGYFVEGHAPAQDIKRLLAENPDARGLVLPGMPAGSPGMEMPDGGIQAYTVELVGRDGSTTAFAHHGQ